MDHPKTVEFDARMKALFDRLDAVLEERHAGRWRPRRNRPERGATANPEADGLFNLGVFFDPGYGSGTGRGYLVEALIAVEGGAGDEERAEIESELAALLEAELPKAFPERRLRLVREGRMLEIVGDLSLGSV